MQLYYAAPLTADGLRHALLANRTQALTWLYQQSFPPVQRYITRQGGAAQDAQDVFQDARVLLYEQATGGTLVLTASVSTYLLNISRNLWRLRRELRQIHARLYSARPGGWFASLRRWWAS